MWYTKDGTLIRIFGNIGRATVGASPRPTVKNERLRRGTPPGVPVNSLLEFFPFRYGQFVAAVVFGVVRVALNPMIVHLMHMGQLQKLFPKIRV